MSAVATDHWLLGFDGGRLRRLVSRRTLDLALASTLGYLRPPAMVNGGLRIVATLGPPPDGPRGGSGESFRVELRLSDGNTSILGECSRCSQAFGPCGHVATLGIDLASSRALRDALVQGRSTEDEAARAPAIRFALHSEERFDTAFGAWLAPSAEGARVEISASAFTDTDMVLGRGYGERGEPSPTRAIAIVVRRAGERKLFAPREVSPPSAFGLFSSRDRRVLDHTRDRGAGKKAVYAWGVEASLALEAMRLHGGIFAEGWKGLLDFRSAPVRPSITLLDRDGDPAAAVVSALTNATLETLEAAWVGTAPSASGAPLSIAFSDSVFFPGPFPFVWTREGSIYPVAKDVDLDFAAQLARAPRLHVPQGRLRDAGGRLARASRGRGISLPPLERFGLAATETPRLVLRLAGEPLDVTGTLVAVYRGREVPLVPTARAAGVDPSEEGRDLDEEERARAVIERIGLFRKREDAAPTLDSVVSELARSEGGEVEPPHAPEPPPFDEEALIGVADDDAIAFWQEGLPRLRTMNDPPIEVELSDRLARVRVGAPLKGRVQVVLEGNWLATKLDFTSNELPVELEAIRTALAQKKRWVSLSDGTLARISTSIEALSAEAGAVMKGSEGKLPAHQLGRLDRWIEENDGRMDAAVEGLRSRLRKLAVSAEPDMPEGLSATLRPYQLQGLAWLQFLQALGAGGILADDMGLGKTITTLAFLLRRKQLEGPAPSLVVCPTSVATNWVREAARFTPDLKVRLRHGPARARNGAAFEGADVVVTTYALLRRDVAALAAIPFRCVVLDEAQNIKNADSATTRAASKLDAGMRLALSGTPIENRLRELWSLASFSNPGILGTVRSFETRFERPISTDRQSPLADELRAVVRPFLLRRTKDDVLRELPPKTEVDRFVTLKSHEKRLYDALAHALRAGVAKDVEKRGGQSSLSVFAALTRLRQMACDPRLVDKRLARDGVESAKREAFLDLVRELVAEGRRALVFSQFVELLTLWRRDLDAEGIAYEYLDGKTTKRDEVVTRFQEGSSPLFLISLKAGGAGLNLTAADTVIHCDPWWNPAVEDQATDRAYRIGQDRPVTVVRLVARGTIEEKILALKAKKRDLTARVIGGDARALEGLTDDDVRLLLGETEEDDEAFSDEAEKVTKTDQLASSAAVLDPDFEALAVEVQWWLSSAGRLPTDLAALVDLPVEYANRLAKGEPFPCSRAVADRIRARLSAF